MVCCMCRRCIIKLFLRRLQVSAANGAEKHYQVRKESIEEAKDLDDKIQGELVRSL